MNTPKLTVLIPFYGLPQIIRSVEGKSPDHMKYKKKPIEKWNSIIFNK